MRLHEDVGKKIDSFFLKNGLTEFVDRFFSYFTHGELYVVGGFVRDSLLGRDVADVDFVVRLVTSSDFESFLNSHSFDYTLVGSRFGVYKILIKGKVYDFAFPRTEKSTGAGYVDFDVVFDPGISLESDSERRDLTINAVYIDLKDRRIFDFHNGFSDLQNKHIVFIGNGLDRLTEDKTRLFRALRFSILLDFDIKEDSKKAIHDFVSHNKTALFYYDEMIAREIRKMFNLNFKKAYTFFLTFDLFNYFFPKKLFTLEDFEQYAKHFALLKNDFLVISFSLLVGTSSVDEIMARATFLKKQLFLEHAFAKNSLTIVEHLFLVMERGFSALDFYDIYRYYVLHVYADELIALHDFFDVPVDMSLIKNIRAVTTQFDVDAFIGGDEVMEYFDITEGVAVGKILKKIRALILSDLLEEKVIKKESILARVKKQIKT